MVKHIKVAEKSLLAGDEVVDLLLEYAALLGQERSADSVDVAAIGPDGNEVVVSFLLNSGVTIVAETTTSTIPEPDNRKVEEYLRSRISGLIAGPAEAAEDIAGADVWNTTEAE